MTPILSDSRNRRPHPLPDECSWITPTQHEKNEWSRLARWAYANDRNDVGHRFSMAASARNGESISIALFDSLQRGYRSWLIDGMGGAE